MRHMAQKEESEGWIFISISQKFNSAIRPAKVSNKVVLDPTSPWVASPNIPFTEALWETFAVPSYPHSPSPTGARLFVRAVLPNHRAQCLFYNKAFGQSEGMQPWWRAMPAPASLSGPGVWCGQAVELPIMGVVFCPFLPSLLSELHPLLCGPRRSLSLLPFQKLNLCQPQLDLTWEWHSLYKRMTKSSIAHSLFVMLRDILMTACFVAIF